MSIQSLSVKNFRSLKAVEDWRPGPLNVLIGPNASGKSNVLRAIDLLAASAKGVLTNAILSAGGMNALAWDGCDNHFDFQLAYTLPEKPEHILHYDVGLMGFIGGGTHTVASEQVLIDQKPLLGRIMLEARLFDQKDAKGTKIKGDIPSDETVLSLIKGLFSQNSYLPILRKHLAGFAIYHDFHTNRDAAIRQAAVTRHETRVDADGQNLISVLHTLYTGNRDFKNTVNDAMTAAFGSDFEELVFPPASDNRIQLRLRWRSLKREQSAADLSDGTLRFLFLLTVLASPDPAPLIAIDEPETGLHPSMLPILAEHAVEASKKAQIIFTTHSPQMLDAFSSETRPQTTVVKREDGETKLHVLDDAKLSHWLEEYSLGALHRSGELEEMAA